MYAIRAVIIVYSLVQQLAVCGSIPPPPISERIEIRKCCSEYEFMSPDTYNCSKNSVNQTSWKPVFTDPLGREGTLVQYHVSIGIPVCQSRQPWVVFQYNGSCDKLILLPDGKLRHYLLENQDNSQSCSDEIDDDTAFVDYNVSDYCIDKSMSKFTENGKDLIGQMAMMCVPTNEFPWQDMNIVMQRIINPVFHVLAIVCLLIVGVVYFVLPQLSDLVGNIITTLVVCLIFEQIADIIRIFDEYHSAMSYLVSDSVMYISSLGAFFWLNSFGYYIWKTFRSRHVFLRITDGKKYCYYSMYAWGSTGSMAAMALFAHLFLDTNTVRREPKSPTEAAIAELGIAVFLTTIIFTVFVNIFFCLSTLQIIGRMSTYGRIHHKLKYSFQLFVKLFIIITINWFFFILSWIPLNKFLYMHIVVNLLQAIAILYVTVFNLKKVRFLLRKACCHENCIFPCCRPGDPGEVPEWGEEMMAMNRSSY